MTYHAQEEDRMTNPMPNNAMDYAAMSLHAKPGSRVRFVNFGGYDSDKEHARKYLKAGESYTVKHVKVGNWSSTVEFEEFPGEHFNTVMFDDPLAPPPAQVVTLLPTDTGGEDAMLLREIAVIICPGAWWDGEPPNDHQQRRVDLALDRARRILSAMRRARQTESGEGARFKVTPPEWAAVKRYLNTEAVTNFECAMEALADFRAFVPAHEEGENEAIGGPSDTGGQKYTADELASGAGELVPIPPAVEGEKRERLENERNELNNSFGESSFRDGLKTARIAEIEKELVTITPPAPAVIGRANTCDHANAAKESERK